MYGSLMSHSIKQYLSFGFLCFMLLLKCEFKLSDLFLFFICFYWWLLYLADCALTEETIIAGNESCSFKYSTHRGNESSDAYTVALVFARHKNMFNGIFFTFSFWVLKHQWYDQWSLGLGIATRLSELSYSELWYLAEQNTKGKILCHWA